MPKTPKESDDEHETKTGRRSRAVTMTDSPLRRSTRNKHPANADVLSDGANNAPGPFVRNTKRKAASQEIAITETRSLRSRKTSTTSETSDINDVETLDGKRTTRKSTTSSAQETPTTARLRRSVRAGSESKTIKSPAIMRKIRASSLDLEERDDAVSDNLPLAHMTTPMKSRRRASALPSEPVLIEETEKEIVRRVILPESLSPLATKIDADEKVDDVIMEDNDNMKNDSLKTMDLTQSPALRLNISESDSGTVTDNEKMLENLNDNKLPPVSGQSTDDSGLKLIVEEAHDKNNQTLEDIDEINNSTNSSAIITANEILLITNNPPKVVIEKCKSPYDQQFTQTLEKSLSNKENQKTNVTVQIKKLKFPPNYEPPVQRQSLLNVASEKVPISKRLNSTVDDQILIQHLDASKTSLIHNLPESIKNDNYLSSNIEPDTSVIIISEVEKPSESLTAACPDVNAKESSVLIMDTSINSINIEAPKDTPTKDKSTFLNRSMEESAMVIDEENTSKPQSRAFDQLDISRKSQNPESTDSDGVIISSTNEKNNENTTLDAESKEEIVNKQKMSLIEQAEHLHCDDSRTLGSESDADIMKLFKDIPADEYSESNQSTDINDIGEKSTQVKLTGNKDPDVTDEDPRDKDDQITSNDDDKLDNNTEDGFELVLVNKKAWEAAEQVHLEKLQANQETDSVDSMLVRSNLPANEMREYLTPASPQFEEPMDTDKDDLETDVKPKITENNINTSSILLAAGTAQYIELSDIDEDDNGKDNQQMNEEEISTLNKSSYASNRKSPIKKLTPIKIDQTELKVSPIKASYEHENLIIEKSLNSSPTAEKSLNDSRTKKNKKILDKSKTFDVSLIDTDEQEKKVSPLKSAENTSRKSLNKSINFLNDSTKNEANNQDDVICISPRLHKSLDKSLPKKESNADNIISKQSMNKSSSSKLNFSTSVQVNSDSDVEDVDTESGSDEQQSLIIPLFLYGDDSSDLDENDSSSLNSDIQREYNLNGDSNSEFSDDNIPGDLCRASETEESDSEDQDDDMSDFIVKDDEDIEEEAEDEASTTEVDDIDDDDNHEETDDYEDNTKTEINTSASSTIVSKKKFNEDEDDDDGEAENVVSEDEVEVEDDDDGEAENVVSEDDCMEIDNDNEIPEITEQVKLTRNVKKHLEFNSSIEPDHEKLQNKKNISPFRESMLALTNKRRQTWNEQCENSLNYSPKIEASKTLPIAENTDKTQSSAKKKFQSPKAVAATNKSIDIDKSNKLISNKSGKKTNPLFDIDDKFDNRKTSKFVNEDSGLSKTSSLNRTMVEPYTTSPEVVSLLKETLNDTLPALKLNQRRSRRSALFFVEEDINENKVCDEYNKLHRLPAAKQTIDELMEDKKKKKSQKKKPKYFEDDNTSDDSSDNSEKSLNIENKCMDDKVSKKNKRIKKANDFTVEDTSSKVCGDSQISFDTKSLSIDKCHDKKKKNNKTNKIPVNPSALMSVTNDDEILPKNRKKSNIKFAEIIEVKEKSQKKKKKSKPTVIQEKMDESAVKVKTNKAENKTAIDNGNVKNKKKRIRSEMDTSCSLISFKENINNDNNFVKAPKDSKKTQLTAGLNLPQQSTVMQNKLQRLPDDVLENLSVVPVQPKKRRKISVDQRLLPSRTMFDTNHPKPENLTIEDDGYIPLSSSGGTTSFYVKNLEKPKKSKKLAAVYSFRERMLRRNLRQPVSAYLMYQQKLKAANKDKY